MKGGRIPARAVGDGSARRCGHRLASGSHGDSGSDPICQKCMSTSFMSGYRGPPRINDHGLTAPQKQHQNRPTAHIRYDCCALRRKESPMKESPMNDMRRVHAEQLMSSLELSLPPVAHPRSVTSCRTTCRCLRGWFPQDARSGRRPRRAPSRQQPVTTPCARLASTRTISRARRPRSRMSCKPPSRP